MKLFESMRTTQQVFDNDNKDRCVEFCKLIVMQNMDVKCFNQTHVHLWIKETNGFNFTNEIWSKFNYNVSLFLWTTLHVLIQWMKWNKCLQLNNFVVVTIHSWMKTLVFLLYFQFYLSFFFNFSLLQITFLQQTPFFPWMF